MDASCSDGAKVPAALEHSYYLHLKRSLVFTQSILWSRVAVVLLPSKAKDVKEVKYNN